MRFPLAILLTALLALCVAGCGPQPQAPQQAPAASQDVAGEAGHEEALLRVAAPTTLQGVVEELADSYAADKEWLSFEVAMYASAKKENKALVPADPEDAETGDAAPLTQADIVFQNSASAMDAAEELGAADPLTRVDMLEDALCIVVGADSKLDGVSTADIEAGSYPLAVVDGSGVLANRQAQVLSALGADGAKGTVEVESVAALFSTLAANAKLASIVRTSDVYRYGGVKVAGSIPARLYSPMRYPVALAPNQPDDTAHDFLSWLFASEDAQRIIEKWGFRYSS